MKLQLSRLALVLMLSAARAGCSLLQVGPDYQQPALSLPGKWFQANDTALPAPAKVAELAEWWKQLADPQLDALIERALQGSLDLRPPRLACAKPAPAGIWRLPAWRLRQCLDRRDAQQEQ